MHFHPSQINNAGTNKGFRPLLQFTDEDIKQVTKTYIINEYEAFLMKLTP
jgi:hypothetical protein